MRGLPALCVSEPFHPCSEQDRATKYWIYNQTNYKVSDPNSGLKNKSRYSVLSCFTSRHLWPDTRLLRELEEFVKCITIIKA